mgnify:CR=1 FL=1
MEQLQEDLLKIPRTAWLMAESEFVFSAEVNHIFGEITSMLGVEPGSIERKLEENESLEFPDSLEGKTLLLDLLLLIALMQSDYGNEQQVFLLKSMHRIQLAPSDYIVFPFKIPFEEFRKKSGFNMGILRQMLWTKVSHCFKQRIFLPLWTETMTCYVSKIDQQHRYMIERFADYVLKINNKTQNDEIMKMLKVLQSYSVEHFRTEESYMKKVNYPLFSEHQKEHGKYVVRYKYMLTQYQDNKSIEVLKENIAHSLNWFLNHVRDWDTKAGFFMKVKEFGAIKKNRLLLSVEDEEYSKELEVLLNDVGFESLIQTNNPKEILDWVQTGDIAACIFSGNKQIFSGVEALQKIRKNALDIPVLLLPVRENLFDLQKNIKKLRLEHTANYLLVRPFSADSLLHRLNLALYDRKKK